MNDIPIIRLEPSLEQAERLLKSFPYGDMNVYESISIVEKNLALEKLNIHLYPENYVFHFLENECRLMVYHRDNLSWVAVMSREHDEDGYHCQIGQVSYSPTPSHKLMDKAVELRAVNAVLQYAITHPERVFREGKNGKRVLNKAPRHGNDEPLYQQIKALRSLIQETHSTGKGTPHRHEYDVRGHYRHYKNGKVVFVKPYTCCAGKGVKNFHEYEV